MRELKIGSGRIELLQADITSLKTDAIVTAANARLAGGGGVDGAVHRAAGPKLLEACREVGGCETGSAVITMAYDLQDRGVPYVIHAVGPIWQGGAQNEEALLADTHDCKSVAFPPTATGVYGFPTERAAPIAIAEMKNFLEAKPDKLSHIVVSLFSLDALAAFEKALRQIA